MLAAGSAGRFAMVRSPLAASPIGDRIRDAGGGRVRSRRRWVGPGRESGRVGTPRRPRCRACRCGGGVAAGFRSPRAPSRPRPMQGLRPIRGVPKTDRGPRPGSRTSDRSRDAARNGDPRNPSGRTARALRRRGRSENARASSDARNLAPRSAARLGRPLQAGGRRQSQRRLGADERHDRRAVAPGLHASPTILEGLPIRPRADDRIEKLAPLL